MRRRKTPAAVLCTLVLAAGAARATDDVLIVPKAYRECVVCHGVEFMGNRAVDAPKLAGLSAWYVADQLRAFRKGWRGAAADDPAGMEMAPQATVLNEDQIDEVAALVARAPELAAPATVAGDAAAGERLYRTCAVCHGARGEGNPGLKAPRLAGQNDWYLVRQLEGYRSGARGRAPGDIMGAQMRAQSMVLPGEQAVRDVVAYIHTLQTAKEKP